MPTLEQNKLMSELAKARGFGKWMKGKKHTEETKRKISLALYNNPPRLNKKHTFESREKIRLSLIGSKRRLGTKHSEDTKRKMRSMFKGISLEERYGVEEAKDLKNRISNSSKGKKISEGHKEILRKVMKKRRANMIIPSKDTSIEVKIQSFLKLLHVEFMPHFYISDITHAYQCDILIPSMKTIIECDGCYYHGCSTCKISKMKDIELKIKKDSLKTQELIEKGYRVIRLWEHDIKKMDVERFKEIMGVF